MDGQKNGKKALEGAAELQSQRGEAQPQSRLGIGPGQTSTLSFGKFLKFSNPQAIKFPS